MGGDGRQIDIDPMVGVFITLVDSDVSKRFRRAMA